MLQLLTQLVIIFCAKWKFKGEIAISLLFKVHNREKEANLVADWRASKLEIRRKLAAINKIQVTLPEIGEIFLHIEE